MSVKRLARSVYEFAGRDNLLEASAIYQVASTVKDMEGKRLASADLIFKNKLDREARL